MGRGEAGWPGGGAETNSSAFCSNSLEVNKTRHQLSHPCAQSRVLIGQRWPTGILHVPIHVLRQLGPELELAYLTNQGLLTSKLARVTSQNLLNPVRLILSAKSTTTRAPHVSATYSALWFTLTASSCPLASNAFKLELILAVVICLFGVLRPQAVGLLVELTLADDVPEIISDRPDLDSVTRRASGTGTGTAHPALSCRPQPPPARPEACARASHQARPPQPLA